MRTERRDSGGAIDWDDLAGCPQTTSASCSGRVLRRCQIAICPRCGRVMILPLPEHTVHHHLEAARNGYQSLTHCPKCQRELYSRPLSRRNLPN